MNTKKSKVGVACPTFNRPDFARMLVLQMANQERVPDVVCIHQNGTPESYESIISDIAADFEVFWIHTAKDLPREHWYSVPIRRLLEAGCSEIFWCDHDDLYFRNHISRGLKLLHENQVDFSVNKKAEVLILKEPYELHTGKYFNAASTMLPGGMSSSMCFNRQFADEFVKDLETNLENLNFADHILTRITKKKFKCHHHEGQATTVYVCHPGTVTSRDWLVSGEEVKTVEKRGPDLVVTSELEDWVRQTAKKDSN
jgi:hypothetical protein